MSAIASQVTNLAQLNPNSGINARNILLGIVGTFTLVVLAFRALGAFADERYGKLATLIIAAIPVFGFAYFPDETVNIFKSLYTSLIS